MEVSLRGHVHDVLKQRECHSGVSMVGTERDRGPTRLAAQRGAWGLGNRSAAARCSDRIAYLPGAPAARLAEEAKEGLVQGLGPAGQHSLSWVLPQ